MKIGIIGGGVVGRATARCWMEYGEVRVYDVDARRSTHSEEDVLGCDVVFVCLPTPQRQGWLECDTSCLDEFFARHAGSAVNFVIRSTVPVGYTRAAAQAFSLPNVCHSPEFLTARCAVTDAQIPSRNIVGFVSSSQCPAKLAEMYQGRFAGVPVLTMLSDESEMVKLTLNSFFAVKVAFFNEAKSLADRLGVSWQAVLTGVLSDGRVAHSHTQVPGPDGKGGFGGACLPKDLASFTDSLLRRGLRADVCLGAAARNAYDRTDR